MNEWATKTRRGGRGDGSRKFSPKAWAAGDDQCPVQYYDVGRVGDDGKFSFFTLTTCHRVCSLHFKFVSGNSLTSGQLFNELFPDCTMSCVLQIVLRLRGGDRFYEMRCLFVAEGHLPRSFGVNDKRASHQITKVIAIYLPCSPDGIVMCKYHTTRLLEVKYQFVCGISLTSGQLVSELFPDCTRSCFSQVVLRPRGGDRIYEMRCLSVAVGRVASLG